MKTGIARLVGVITPEGDAEVRCATVGDGPELQFRGIAQRHVGIYNAVVSDNDVAKEPSARAYADSLADLCPIRNVATAMCPPVMSHLSRLLMEFRSDN